ncbi:MAG: hypothetical protein HY835_09115 [Anaerolineae bacterium]|nr:hypothetical protein [Anaerolineae bacterium]
MDLSTQPRSSHWWKKVLLSILSLVLMASSIPTAAVFPADYVFFQPQPDLDQLERSGIEQKYADLATGYAGQDETFSGLTNFIRTLFPADRYAAILTFIFPSDWLVSQLKHMITDYWAYYNFEARALSLQLDFVPIKQRLQGQTGKALVSEVFDNLPECTAQNLLEIGAQLLKGQEVNWVRCKPPEAFQEPVYTGIQTLLTGMTGGLPDQVVLMQRESETPGRYGPGGSYAKFRYGLRLSFVLTLMLLVAGYMLKNSLLGLLEWSGPPLFVGGILAALLASGTGAAATWLAQAVIAILPGSAGPFFELVSGIVLGVFEQALAWCGFAGVIIATIGLFAILISRWQSSHQSA